MHRPYSLEYENELLDLVREYGVTDEDLVCSFFGYFSSDDTCAFLEEVCDTYDVPYDEDDEEE